MSLPLPVTTPSEKREKYAHSETTRHPVELVVAVHIPEGERSAALRELPTPAPLRGYRLTRLMSYEEVDANRIERRSWPLSLCHCMLAILIMTFACLFAALCLFVFARTWLPDLARVIWPETTAQ